MAQNKPSASLPPSHPVRKRYAGILRNSTCSMNNNHMESIQLNHGAAGAGAGPSAAAAVDGDGIGLPPTPAAKQHGAVRLRRRFKLLNDTDSVSFESQYGLELSNAPGRQGEQRAIINRNLRLLFDKGAPSHRPPLRRKYKRKDLEIWNKIGEGTFGVVHLALVKACRSFVALKRVNMSGFAAHECEDLKREIHIQAQLEHGNILRLFGSFRKKDTMNLVLEHATGGDLFGLLQRKKHIPEPVVAHYVSHLANGLRYLHGQKFVHRDLKLENCLLVDGVVKVCDFGFAIHVDDIDDSGARIGTCFYMSPEIVASSPYNEKTDVWSFGMILCELILGVHPLVGETDEELFKEILDLDGDLDYSEEDISESALDLVNMILVRDPTKRPSFGQILLHPWMQDNLAKYSTIDFNDAESDDDDEADLVEEDAIRGKGDKGPVGAGFKGGKDDAEDGADPVAGTGGDADQDGEEDIDEEFVPGLTKLNQPCKTCINLKRRCRWHPL